MILFDKSKGVIYIIFLPTNLNGMLNNTILYQNTYCHQKSSYPINNQGCGISDKIIKTEIELIKTHLELHKRIFLLRFDLRFSLDEHAKSICKNNKLITSFFSNLKRKFLRRYKGTKKDDFGYFWVREVGKEYNKKTHYHCFVLINGKHIRNFDTKNNLANNESHGLRCIIDKTWVYGSVRYPESNKSKGHIGCYRNIKLHEKEKLDEAVYFVSYLAKIRGKIYISKDGDVKSYNPMHIHTFNHSKMLEIKRKIKKRDKLQ